MSNAQRQPDGLRYSYNSPLGGTHHEFDNGGAEWNGGRPYAVAPYYVAPFGDILGALVASETERDKLAESERSWQELASARGAALKAMVEASGALIEGIDEFSSDCTTRYETCLEDLDDLRDALAAAKVQP